MGITSLCVLGRSISTKGLAIQNKVLHSFLQGFQSNGREVSHIRPRPLPSTTFPIHLPYIVTWWHIIWANYSIVKWAISISFAPSLPSINATTTFILNVTQLHLKFLKCHSLWHVSGWFGHHDATIILRKSPHCTHSRVNTVVLLRTSPCLSDSTLSPPSSYSYVQQSCCVPCAWFSCQAYVPYIDGSQWNINATTGR
jgi:hypothetical protein